MKTMLMRTLVVALAFAGMTGRAVAQGEMVDPSQVPQLKAEFDRAAKQNVPTAPLMATARHGMLIGVPTNKIRDAVRGYTDRYVTAREALSPSQGEAEIQAGADALQQNISKTVLKTMRTTFPQRSLTVPIGTLQILVSKGVDIKQAQKTVNAMLTRKDSDTRIASLSTEMQGLLTQGLAPSMAFDALSRGVLSLPQAPASGATLSPQRR